MSAHSLLGFTIERRAGVDVVVFANDSCRPAMETEVAMWNRLALAPNPITHLVVADVPELGTVTCGYSGQPSEIARAVMAKACAQGYSGSYQDRLAELGWRVEPVYLAAPPPPAAPAVDLEPFREPVNYWHNQCSATHGIDSVVRIRREATLLLAQIDEQAGAHPKERAFLQTVAGLDFDPPIDPVVQAAGRGPVESSDAPHT